MTEPWTVENSYNPDMMGIETPGFGESFMWVVVMLIVTILGIVFTLYALWPTPTYRYGDKEWYGDECYVENDQLWCREGVLSEK